MSFRNIVTVLLLVLFVLPGVAQQKKAADEGMIDIPYQKFVLNNGLTVIIHEDHKAPIVAVNVWYHVGSKDEKPGKSGFAHLFEHLMFNGSENFNEDYFKAMERVGATDLNGTTNEDRTNYFQNVPTSAFDLALWMESDRMGHLLGVIDKPKLDEQRGVVQNEKRQGENQPYAIAYELMEKAAWPKGHPYDHTVIGSMEDLNAASLEDVKEWFKKSYGPSNAVLAIAGDVDAKAALDLVKKYFGDIPPGPPVAHFDTWVAKRTGASRQEAQDRVAQARIYKVWNMPGWKTLEARQLDLVSDVLSMGKSSRLYKRLVYDDQIATNVNAYIDLREIGGLFVIDAMAKPGEDLAKVEKAIDEELAKFLQSGPTPQEVDRVKTQFVANFTRGIERIGGFGGKSDILAQNEVYAGGADFYKTTLQRVRSMTPEDLHRVAKEWLSDGQYVLEIHPFPKLASAAPDTMLRKSLPRTGTPPQPKFPKFERTTLSSGLKVILAQRTSVPLVNFNLLINAGYAADQFGLPGTAGLAMNMMDEGTTSRSALQISDELQMLGASIGTWSDLDLSYVNLSSLKSNLDKSLELYADVILNPSFPKADFDRLQKLTLAGIQRERMQPFQMALRVLPGLIYGKKHAYGLPFTGSGFESTVSKLTREDMAKFHQTWVKPNNATLVVVGDVSMSELLPKLDKTFKNWKRGDVPTKNISEVRLAEKQTVYIMDKPGAEQSVILTAHIAPPQNNPDEIAIQTLNTALGGSFTSRINMNLRENKHWSYGAGTAIIPARAQRPFIVYGPVQTDKTKESMIEISKELNEIMGSRPPADDEVLKVKNNLTLSLPGNWETNGAVLGSLVNIVRFGLPDNYYDTYPGKINALSVSEVGQAAKKLVHPVSLVWVVVGDKSKIEQGIRELKYGEVRFIDGDGNVIE